MSAVAETLDFQVIKSQNSIYQYIPNPPLNTSTVVLGSASSGQLVVPVSCANNSGNPYRPYIKGTLTFLSSGAGQYSWVYAMDCPLFSGLTVTGKNSGTVLYDVQGNLPRMLEGNNKIVQSVNKMEQLFTSEVDANTQYLEYGSLRISGDTSLRANKSQVYLLAQASAATVYTVNFCYYLNQLGGIFALDKSIPFNEDLLFTFSLNGYTNLGFATDDNADPDSGVTALLGCTLSDFNLYWPSEQNPEINNALRSLVYRPEGLSIQYPSLITTQQAISASTQHNVQQSVSAGNGLRLLWATFVPFNSTAANRTMFNHISANFTNIQLYNDGTPINPNGALTAKEWWQQYRHTLKDGLIASYDEFLVALVFWFNFTGASLPDIKTNQEMGLSTQNGMNLSITANWGASTTCTWQITMCFQNILNISANGMRKN